MRLLAAIVCASALSTGVANVCSYVDTKSGIEYDLSGLTKHGTDLAGSSYHFTDPKNNDTLNFDYYANVCENIQVLPQICIDQGLKEPVTAVQVDKRGACYYLGQPINNYSSMSVTLYGI